MSDKVTLHRCPFTFLKTDLDSCWKVQKELDAQGIPYEIRKHWEFPRGRRKALIEKSGQQMLPVVEFADGSTYREESKDMGATVRSGGLFERAGTRKRA